MEKGGMETQRNLSSNHKKEVTWSWQTKCSRFSYFVYFPMSPFCKPIKTDKNTHPSFHWGRKNFKFASVPFIVKVMVRKTQFSSITQSCLTLCNATDCSTPGFPVHHQLLEITQIHVLRIGDAIQSFHPLLSPSPPAFNLYQHQGLFKWVSSSHQVAKVLEFQLQHQSFQWTPRTDLL